MVKKKRKKKKSVNKYSKTKNPQLAIPGNAIEETSYDHKMSQVILEFAEPVLQKCEADVQQGVVIGLSIVVWNASFVSEERREESKKDIIEKMSSNDLEAQFILDIWHSLLARKERYFPHVKRVVLKHKVIDLGDRLDFTVASAPISQTGSTQTP